MNLADLVERTIMILLGSSLLVGCYIHDEVTEKRNVQRPDPWRESVEVRARMRARKRDVRRQMLEAAQRHRR
ncbi:hypothetical protein [Streptomyces sp. NBC_01235]|uniref:hypothetical protein n=1 Tax=Streptomyces sp. NBC_01235 TaxID=2903788 RepID=UPI002E0FDE08|nr:hypothetical protein OG289_08115 [Streptomyces sp. NBC_01235]